MEASGAGEITIVRYADDAIVGFERQRGYGLELNEDKRRLIGFGRFAAMNRSERGEGKPEVFTFLGLRPICVKKRVGHAPLVLDPVPA